MNNRQRRVKYRALVYLIIVFFLLGLGGCKYTANTPAKTNEASAAAGSYPLNITDDMGRQVTLPAEPVRIISLAPSNTEILFALDLGSRVVGNTTYCDYPDEAKNISKIGGFMDPSLEQIVALKPDLVLATDIHRSFIKSLEDAGLKVLVLNPLTLEEIFDSILMVGKAAGVEKRAVELTVDLKNRVQAISQKTANITEEQKPTVFYEMWYQPLMSIGKGNLIGQMIQIAGGNNITGEIPELYPQVSEELIIARSPQVMINSYGHENQEISSDQIKDRAGWQNISFVKSNRIYTINSDLLTLPGPRIVEGLEKMAVCLHPELFKQN